MIRLILLLLALLAVGFVVMGREPPEGATARLIAPESDDSAQAPATVADPAPEPVAPDAIRPLNPTMEAEELAVIPSILTPRIIADEGRSAPLNPDPATLTAGDVTEGAEVPVVPLSDGQVQPDPPARGVDGFTEGVPADPATAGETTWFVAADKVNLRSGESTDFAVVGAAYQGEPLVVLSDPNAEWVQVRTLGGVDAYVKSEFLTPNGPLQ